MPPNSGYSSSLPTDVLLDTGVLYLNGTTPWGVSKGGVTVNLPQDYQNVDFDGKIYNIVGLDRLLGGEASFEGTFLELNATKAATLLPGSTTSGTTTVTITPHVAGDLLSSGSYQTNVRVVFRRGGGGYVWVMFAYALLTVESISGSPKSEGEYKIKAVARQDAAAASLGVVPWTVQLASAV